MQKENKVDWEWANALPALSICDAVTLSLGYELMSFAPVDWTIDRPTLDAPPEYANRVFLTYQNAILDIVKRTGGTALVDATYDPNAEFINGQFWEVDIADFRRFCDYKKWPVPAEFLPDEYAASQLQKYPDPSAIIELRQKNGMTQKQAAECTQVSSRAWQHWEAGDRRMHPAFFNFFNLKSLFHKKP